MIAVIGWLGSIVLAALIIAVIFRIGLIGVHKNQEDTSNPLDKESNYWW